MSSKPTHNITSNCSISHRRTSPTLAQVAKTAPPGSNMLVMLPDTAERYLSTPLFGDIPADMTEEEKEIANSTPSTPPPGITMPEVTQEAGEEGHGSLRTVLLRPLPPHTHTTNITTNTNTNTTTDTTAVDAAAAAASGLRHANQQ